MTREHEELMYQLNAKLSSLAILNHLFCNTANKQLKRKYDNLMAERFASAMSISRSLRPVFSEVARLAEQRGMELVTAHVKWINLIRQ